MKKMTGYKLTDGTFIENYDEAIKLQKELDFKKKLRLFCDKNMPYEYSDYLYETICDNADELRDLLNDFSNDKLCKGCVTEAVPKNSWLHPYIGYDVQWNEKILIVDGAEYANENYEARKYLKRYE